ncbi:hypothetical protein K490DRAFT_56355 [Saccharata proteae CBS 121410]|uniref:Vezatin n=1 Tax=Saccharata proteae CBS 121410 TaxID=1314787 RepID=A0A9P4HUM6_9PEZI|nr:hypothetical protein K490DRAFT_56355 [Saccharata proteae CBS 121410]
MDNIIYEDSPLAAYLEGEGTGDPSWVASRQAASDDEPQPSFAPRGPSALQTNIRKKLPRPLQLHLSRHGPLQRVHSAFSRAVNSRLGRADNARFLEHFRYILVASQLLNEHIGQSAFRYPTSPYGGSPPAVEYKGGAVDVAGAVVSGVGAFVVVWLIHWARGARPGGFSKSRLLLVMTALAVSSTIAYSFVQRQWLQHLRHRAIVLASDLVTNLQAFDTATASALMLIQEVELVSRGYRLSTPLPPITRIDDKGQQRRCARLRRSLHSLFAAVLPPYAEAVETLRALVDEDDLDRYFDVYDITPQDAQEAALGYTEGEFEDAETLKSLRIWQFRLVTLRRAYLCSLLAVEADGERLRAQVRNMSSLSQGIRGLQAKMQLLREESNKSLEELEDVTELGSNLMSQYDSIGADLKSLVQAWESGKSSLALNIDRHERRISQASSGLRSPAPSLGGLTVVGEGDPSDALRALTGECMNGSGSSNGSGSGSDEEIFEAIAVPRTRLTMSREERMQKMQDDRVRQQAHREQREANNSMIKELESVINFRPKGMKRPATVGGRVTSI